MDMFIRVTSCFAPGNEHVQCTPLVANLATERAPVPSGHVVRAYAEDKMSVT